MNHLDPKRLSFVIYLVLRIHQFQKYHLLINTTAANEDFATKLLKTGDLYGDMFEVSRIRKEDFDFIKDKSGKYADVIQATRKSSSVTKRGHHYPCAFLQKVN